MTISDRAIHLRARLSRTAAAVLVCLGFWAAGAAFGQTPGVALDVPAEEFVGESFCFTADFTNTGDPGFGPYLLISLPPELTLDAVTLNGLGSTAVLVDTFGPSGSLTDPISMEPISGENGGSLYLIQPPIGSVVENGQAIFFEICTTIDPDAMVGMAIEIGITPGYEFGDTATGANGPILGDTATGSIVPTLAEFMKLGGADEEEAAPGPSWPFDYRLVLDIANGQTVFALDFNDTLPGSIQYVGPTTITGGVNCSIDQEPDTGTPGGDLQVTCDEATGTLAGEDVVVSVPVHFIDILDETICEISLATNTATFDGQGEKPRGSGNLFALPQSEDTARAEAKHAPIQKSASPTTAIPGDTITYTVTIPVSDFAELSDYQTRDTLPDGMTFGAHVSADVDGTPFTIAPTVTVGVDGSTVIEYAIGAVVAPIAPASTITIVYTATIDESFSPPGGAVLASDNLVNDIQGGASITGGVVGCIDTSSAGVGIVPLEISKSVLNPQPEYVPGDVLTFRLEMPIPSGDTSNIVFTDFFPLPVFDVSLIDTTFGVDIRLAATDTLGLTPDMITADPATNSIVIEWPDVNGPPNQVLAVDIDASIVDAPFADNLALANFFEISAENTDGDPQAASAPVLINVGSPSLVITKGVSDSSNPNAAITPPATDLPVDGNVSGIDAGDELTFVTTVENTGGAQAFDVVITDPGVAGLTNCNLVSVTDGVGTPLDTTGSLTTGLSLDDPLAANDEDPAGGGAPFSTDTALVTYTCDLDGTLQPEEIVTNTASAAFASQPGAADHPVVTDTADATMARSSITKTLTGVDPGYRVAGSRVHIGEILTYEVVISLPEGTHNDTSLSDLVDRGLAYVDPASTPIQLVASTGVSTSVVGGFPQVVADANITNSGTGDVNLDRRLVLDFDTVTVTPTSGASTETITITYDVRVLNWDSNDRRDQRNNRADWRWDNAAGTRQTERVRAPNQRIVEAELELVKDITPATGDSGDTVTVTLSLSHANISFDTDAFDVSLVDALPAGLTAVDGTAVVQNCTSAPTSGPTIAANTVTVGWTTFARDTECEITFDATLDPSVISGSTIENCALADWHSLAAADQPLPTPPTNPLAGERTGDPSDPGAAANDYLVEACDTVKISDVTVNKAIVATTEPSTGDSQGSGSITDLTVGETVTYEFIATLPEGTTQPLIVTDSLPFAPGVLALVPGSSTVTNVGGSITIPAGFPTIVEADNALGDGYLDSAVFTFSTAVSDGVLVTDCTVAEDCEITMQVQAIVVDVADNSDGDVLTNSVITQYGPGLSGSDTIDIEIVEPALAITKQADLTTAEGLDTATFTLLVEHTPGSTADAFNVVITDELAAIGLNFVQFVGTGIGACTQDPDTGFPAHSAGVLTAEWESFALGDSCEIVFEAQLDVSVVAGDTVTNTAELNWQSTEDPNDETRDYSTEDSWDIVVSLPGVVKDITETDVSESEDLQKGVAEDLTIGEEVTYEMTVSLQNGTTTGAIFEDQLPTGDVVLRLVSSRIVSIGADLTVPNAAVNDAGDDCLATTCDFNSDGARDKATWDLGDVVDIDGANGAADDIVFEVIAVVTASTNNEGVPGVDINQINTGTLTFVNTGGVQTLSDTEPIDIIAPELELEKDAICIDDDVSDSCEANEPTGSPLIVNGGDQIIYEISIGHTDDSTAHAYNVTALDTLPTGTTFAGAGSVTAITGPAPDGVVVGAGTVEFSWDDPVPPGTTYTIQYAVTVNAGVPAGSQLLNTMELTYDSLPDPQAGDENFAGTDQDDALIVVESPTIVKEVVATSNDETDSSVHDPDLPDLTIGETVTYRLTVVVPALVSGTDLMIVDTVPMGQMEIIGARIVSLDAQILPTTLPGTPVIDDPDLDLLNERVTFDFGDVTNTGELATIVVEVTAVVLDDPANVGTPDTPPPGTAPTVLTNTGELMYVNGLGNPVTVADTADIEVVEPTLDVEKRMGPIEDGFVTVSIDVTNDGTAPGYDPVVTDIFDETIWVPVSAMEISIPAGFELAQTSAAGSTTVEIALIGAPTNPTPDQIIAPGETVTFEFKMELQGGGTPPATEDIENTATGEVSTLPGDDPNERDATDDGEAVIDLPSLDVTKGAVPNPNPAVPGGTITYTITVENIGDADATQVLITDTPDANGTFQAGTVVADLSGNILVGNTAGDLSISVLVPTIAAGATATITYDVVIPNPLPTGLTELVNQAVADAAELPPVDSDDLTDPTAADDPTVVPITAAPDMVIEKSDGGITAMPGGLIVYTLDYRNDGNQAATGIVITETVPANTTFDAAGSLPTVWSCADASPAGTTCTLNIAGPIAGGGAGGSESFAVVVDDPLPATVISVTNTASIEDDGTNGADTNPDNNESTDSTPIDAMPDLQITKDDGDVTASPGEVVVYTLNYGNVGNQDATGVMITETVPVNTTFDAAGSLPTVWSCADDSPAGTVCTTTIGNLDADDTGSASFAVTIDIPFPRDATEVTNSATIADDMGNGDDANPDDNEDDDSTPIEIHPDVEIVKTDALLIDVGMDGFADPGDTLEYTVVMTNTGDVDLPGVLFDDAPDTNTTLLPTTTTDLGTVVTGDLAGDTLVSVDVGTLPYDSSATITFQVEINDPLVAPPGSEIIFTAIGQFPTAFYEIDPQTLNAVYLGDFVFDGQAHAITTCGSRDFVYAIGKNTGFLMQVSATIPPVETFIADLSAFISNRIVQFGCATDNETLYFTDEQTEELYTLDVTTCPSCTPTLVGLVETSPGAADVDVSGADLVFTKSGRLYMATNLPTPSLYRLNPGSGLATFVGPLATPEFNFGLTSTLLDSRLIIESNDDHLYEIDPLTGALVDLGIPTVAGAPFDLGWGDAAGAVQGEVCSVQNQGLFTSDDLPSVVTDDPDTALVGDPTETVIGEKPLLDATKTDELFVDADMSEGVSLGDTLRYTVVVENIGNAADTAFFRDVPGAGSTLVVGSVTTTQGTVDQGNTGGDVVVEVDLGSIAAGASATVTFDVLVDGSEPIIENQGMVTSTEKPLGILTDDPETVGLDDPTATPLEDTVLLESTKYDQLFNDADGSGAPTSGDELRYVITIDNPAATDAI